MLRRSLVVMITITSMFFANAGAEQNYAGMSHAMTQSMNPEVWTKMMAIMMDPSQSSAMESCALCHEGDDLARYAEQYGPMMDSMFGMYKSMSPHQAMQYMNPMMGMMNPMMGMMNPMMYMNMMYPMMGMMGPMMGMMNPMMMGGMMNPMTMMNPMMMNPMMMGGSMGGYNSANPMGSMMDPQQYESWFNQMTEMMKSFTPQSGTQ